MNLLYISAWLKEFPPFPNTREIRSIMGRARAGYDGSVRLNDSVFTETHGLENAVGSEYE